MRLPNFHNACSPKTLVVGLAIIGLSGCSGFVSGGVAGASMDDGRIAVESRSATATVGPSGPAVDTRRGSAAICVDPATNSTVAC